MLCDLFGVSRSSYYDWCKARPSQLAQENQKLSELIKEIFMQNRCNYGARRIRQTLQNQGFKVSRRRVGKLMKKKGLFCKTKRNFKMTTDSNHQLPIAPDLLERHFVAIQPDQKYVGDITYIRTLEGWMYLAVVIDLYSRRVVGWSMMLY